MSNEKKLFKFRQKERPDLEREDRTPTIAFFFKLLWRKLGKLLSLNLMMDFMIFPAVAILLIYIFGRQTVMVENSVFAPLLGIELAGGSPVSGAMMGMFGKLQDTANPSTVAMVVMMVLVAFTAITWGWQNVGAAYNLRSMVRGDSCFLLSDYFYAIKRNFKQGFLFGIVDFLLIGVLVFDLYYFTLLAGTSLWYSVTYFMIIALCIIYLFMRFYLYQMLITFDLSLKKLLKNALIFSMLGIKRNMMALLGIVVLVVLNLSLIVPCLSIGFTLPIILPFFYFPAFTAFMATYAAYPNIKRYMIDGDPTLTSPSSIPEDESEQEAISPPEATH
jgi:uncharacterized membrane protein YesL